MRKALKVADSLILAQHLHYIPGNSNNNKQLSDALLKEQKNFCAYTDEYISRTDGRDVEHFNPKLKGTPQDNYYNWFVVKHQWNMEKSEKWEKFQPVLIPTSEDFENRVIYQNGDYIADAADVEACNLIKLLKLDDLMLAEKRKKYIQRKRDEMTVFNETPEAFFITLISDDICQVSYPRAIREEFGIDIWNQIPEIV